MYNLTYYGKTETPEVNLFEMLKVVTSKSFHKTNTCFDFCRRNSHTMYQLLSQLVANCRKKYSQMYHYAKKKNALKEL